MKVYVVKRGGAVWRVHDDIDAAIAECKRLDKIAGDATIEESEMYSEDVDDALARDEPLRPYGIRKVKGLRSHFRIGKCRCGLKVNDNYPFCHFCGQRLDWSK